MTATYRATGRLIVPVNDLQAARHFLREAKEMEQHIYPDEIKKVVHTVNWDLEDADTWEVTVVTHYRLTRRESRMLSEWIQGQNSDGLGEGFEQQPFAEHNTGEDEAEDFVMSSFDWETNSCTLELVK